MTPASPGRHGAGTVIAGIPRAGIADDHASRPLNVCFVSADYPAASTARAGAGGIGTHTYTLARAIAGLGHTVVVITETETKVERYSDGPVEVYALPRGSQRMWKLGRWVPVSWIRRSFAVWRTFRLLHHQYCFDLVSFPDGYGEGLRYSYSPLVPFAVQLFGPASLVQRWDGRRVPRPRARVEAWVEQRPASRASLLIAATRRFADLVTREWSVDPDRIRIIPNPLDLQLFRPSNGHDRGPKTVLFVGHLQRLKGLHTLAVAIPLVVARHPDVEFQFVGNDTNSAPDGTSMKLFLKKYLSERGVLGHVRFVDPVPQRELVSFYQRCTLFVLPSLHDVYPNAVLEAMACARPSIVSSTVGTSEIMIDGETGFVLPPDDSNALAGAISRVLSMPRSSCDEIGARARRTVEGLCAAPIVAAQTVDAYRDVLSNRAIARIPTPFGGDL